MVFVLGMLVTVAAAVMLGRAAGELRGGILVVLAIVGLSATGLWAVSPLLAGAAGLALGGWLIGLVQPCRGLSPQGVEAPPRSRSQGGCGQRFALPTVSPREEPLA